MTPDPFTEEGIAEIRRRIARRKQEAAEVRERAMTDVDDEPTGKLTEPSEFDLYRDRKEND